MLYHHHRIYRRHQRIVSVWFVGISFFKGSPQSSPFGWHNIYIEYCCKKVGWPWLAFFWNSDIEYYESQPVG